MGNQNEKNQEEKDKTKGNMKTNSRKNVQMPNCKGHSETDALKQVTAGRDGSLIYN